MIEQFFFGSEDRVMLPAIFLRAGGRNESTIHGPHVLGELREVAPVVGVLDDVTIPDQRSSFISAFDMVLTSAEMQSSVGVGALVAMEWRKRLMKLLLPIVSDLETRIALESCACALVPPSSVTEFARARGISREHLTRVMKQRGVDVVLGAKRIADVCIVLQVLVMHAMGVPIKTAAHYCRVSHRTFMRSRARVEEEMPGSTLNFRVLLMHVELKARIAAGNTH